MTTAKEHDDFPLATWQADVAAGDTLLGYAEWVASKVEARGELLDYDDPLEVRARKIATIDAVIRVVEAHRTDALTHAARTAIDQNALSFDVVLAICDAQGHVYIRDADNDGPGEIAWSCARSGEPIFTAKDVADP